MITNKDIIGLIGKNGAGKSTLLKIIAGDIIPDNGNISYPKIARLGFLKQFLPTDTEISIIDETCKAFERFNAVSEKIVVIEKQLEDKTLSEVEIGRLLEQLDTNHQVRISLDVSNPVAEATKILKGLGFAEAQLQHPISTLSGGWQMRVELAKLLLQKPELLLLDEPTNHLDIESIIWFESYVKKYEGAVVIISHDEDFLSNTCNRIIEIHEGKIGDYRLPYRKFLVEKAQRTEILRSQYQNQQKVIKEKERTITRFKAKATKTKMAQSMEKQLEKMEKVEFEEFDITDMKLNFPFSGRCGQIVYKGKDLRKSYDEKLVFKDVNIQFERGDKIAFIGQNGQGKSTLTKIIQELIEPSDGDSEIGYNVVRSYYDQDQSETMDEKLTVYETASKAGYTKTTSELRSILGAFLFSGEEVEKKVSVLSGGEKSRLALACMVMNPSNFIILDEPTNHLDIYSKRVLKNALEKFEGNLLVVSHDRDFLKGLTSKTFEFKDGEVIEHLGDLEYVLAKRKSDDLRDYANTKSTSIEQTIQVEKVAPKLSFEERKKLNRRITYIERDIEKIEAKMETYKTLMADPGFYTSDDSQQKLTEFGKLESELKAKTDEWEGIIEQLEN